MIAKIKAILPLIGSLGIIGLIVGVASTVYVSNRSNVAKTPTEQVELPRIEADKLNDQKHVVSGQLNISKGLTVEGDAAVGSLTTGGIVLGPMSGELKNGQLYRANDGSLRFYDGKQSVSIVMSVGTLQPTLGVQGPAGPAGANGIAGINGAPGLAGTDGAQGVPGAAGAPGGLDVVEILAGQGVLVTDENGSITIAVPQAGQCPTCADASLSNLSSVALSTSLVPANDNSIDIGDGTHAFRNGYVHNIYSQTVQANSLDTSVPGVLSLGATNAAAINLAQDTTLAAGKTFNTTGTVLFQNTTNMLSSFEVQQASGTTVLSVDTANGRIGIGTAAPSYTLDISGDVNVSSGSVYRIGGSEICSTSGCMAASGSGHYIQNQNSNQQSTSNFWINGTGRADAGLQGPSLDTSSASTLSLGTTNATSINLAQNTTVAANKNLIANGTVLFQNATNSTTAFQVQNAAGTTLLKADNIQGILSVGTYVPSIVYTTPAPTVNSYAVGTGPAKIANDDFNGDGKMDIVSLNSIGNTISILMNTGNGTFSAKVDYVTGSSPAGVVTGDLNGDNRADIAVTNSGSSSISIFINNGNGTFAAKADRTTNSVPQAITTGDFNGDGRPDIAYGQGSCSCQLGVLMNNGNGTFAATVTYTTNLIASSLASADFNGDNRSDIAFVSVSSGVVSIFINNGNGTFAAKVDYAAGTRLMDITATDLNNDGRPDLAIARGDTNTLSVLMNNGNGTFATKVDYIATNPEAISFGDFNGDGRPDLVTSSDPANASAIHINNGDGTFAPRVIYTHPFNTRPFDVSAADFNGDGTVDFATSNYGPNTVAVTWLYAFTGVPIPQTASKLVVNASSATVGQLIQGANNQTADLLQVRDSLNTNLFSVGATGSVIMNGALNANSTVLFKNAVDSASAFQVQQTNGVSVMRVDTSNGYVGIGSSSPGYKLSVNSLSSGTGNWGTQLALGTAAASNKGIVIQGVASQTADLLQAQNSTGAVLMSVSPTGLLTVTSAVVSGTLTVNGHVITGGTAPTIAAGSAACTSPAVAVAGNDTSGTITVTSGTACAGAGRLATITFNAAFGTVPRIMMTPKNATSTALGLYNDTATTTSFTIDAATAPADSTSYVFNYWAVQ